jgi:sugar phosphate permease
LTSYAIGQLSLGVSVNAIGRKYTLVLAFALAGASTVAFGFVSSPYAMLVLWGFAGLTAAPASPIFSTIVSESVPDNVRGTAIGVWSSCENLGGVLANSIAAGVLSQTGSWRSVFFVSGPVVAIWAAAMLVVIPADSATMPPSKAMAAVGSTPARPESLTASTAPLSVPGVGAAAFAYTLTKAARYCLMFWLPFFLQDYVKMEPVQSGIIAAVLDVGGTLGAILTGVATDRLYGGCALRAAMHLCAATGACFIGWAAACVAGVTTTPHVIAIGLVGFFIAGPGGVLGASARGLVGYAGLDSDKSLVASVAGLVNGLASSGAVAGSLLAPQLVAFLGWPGLFATLGVAMLTAAATLIPAVAIEAAALEKRKEKVL